MDSVYRRRGFLPGLDPITRFPADSELAMLDDLGRDLPSLLQETWFRGYARQLEIPPWKEAPWGGGDFAMLRLYYIRLGFLASAYINQVGQPPATVLPCNIAIPLCRACSLLQRPPILSYDGYALYNWKRFDIDAPIRLGNIETIQNFVHLYDEHWFILVHVEIEAIAARILDAVASIQEKLPNPPQGVLDSALTWIATAIEEQVGVLRRIPEKMDPRIYFKTFRPYIRFFENVIYQGVEREPINYRGETGAQSSIMPILVGLLKIPHKSSLLTEHLSAIRYYMPVEHQRLIHSVEQMPSIRNRADKTIFNRVLEALAIFREIHYEWAQEYIMRRTTDPRGTGGTPYMRWLKQLIDETRQWQH
ncbi:MAG: hypothetical protein ABFR65_03170 [Pseudomonadota bacterium]